MAMVILSASVERFSVSRMRDFFLFFQKKNSVKIDFTSVGNTLSKFQLPNSNSVVMTALNFFLRKFFSG